MHVEQATHPVSDVAVQSLTKYEVPATQVVHFAHCRLVTPLQGALSYEVPATQTSQSLQTTSELRVHAVAVYRLLTAPVFSRV